MRIATAILSFRLPRLTPGLFLCAGKLVNYVIRDREGTTLDASKGEFGFCKATQPKDIKPLQYQGVDRTGDVEGPLGLLADIAVQQGADYVQRKVRTVHKKQS